MNHHIKLPRVPVVQGRQDIVVARCEGKRVLHLGCVDSGLLEQRYERGELMHQKLAAVAREAWGVDIDAQGIEWLRQLGFPNLVIGDVCNLDKLEELHGRTFDVIVASEVVEHLLNPGEFLGVVRRFMTPGETELIVTVPNAFRLDTLHWLLRGIEYVHPDHNYWFSYQTITNLLKKTGFVIKEVYVYSFTGLGKAGALLVPGDGSLRQAQRSEARRVGSLMKRAISHPLMYIPRLWRRAFVSWFYRRTPFWGDGLIIIATADSGGSI